MREAEGKKATRKNEIANGKQHVIAHDMMKWMASPVIICIPFCSDIIIFKHHLAFDWMLKGPKWFARDERISAYMLDDQPMLVFFILATAATATAAVIDFALVLSEQHINAIHLNFINISSTPFFGSVEHTKMLLKRHSIFYISSLLHSFFSHSFVRLHTYTQLVSQHQHNLPLYVETNRLYVCFSVDEMEWAFDLIDRK